MPRGKGYNGETCQEAIRAIFNPGEVKPYSDLVRQIKERGPWKTSAISQHIMGLIRNLPPARDQWEQFHDPFLFLHEDGRFELYDPARHPQVQS